eukprot:9948182-Heterocapsa_arctica.AAC.1
MDDMDLNIVSMGRLVEEQSFIPLWAPGHGHLWRDPRTMVWTRLRVENFVPVLEPDPDQSGIAEALSSIFGRGIACPTVAGFESASALLPAGDGITLAPARPGARAEDAPTDDVTELPVGE